LATPGPEIELTTLEAIFRRGGPREFLSPQRLNFDLLYRVESGATVHQVDFTPHRLMPGDVLWVRSGQVHAWGGIGDLVGTVALFPGHGIDPESLELLTRGRMQRVNSWAAAEVDACGAATAWESLMAPEPAMMSAAVRSRLRRSGLSAVLLRLSSPTTGESAGGDISDQDETFHWFSAEVEARFRTTHQVSEYAKRLGYSTKTLNRAAAAYGTTPKSVINDRILLEAKRLLTFTSRSVADIGAELGFDDPSNFSSFFRHGAGTTPKTFRAGPPYAGDHH
jgi:AraC-like DNA-binding protein